MRQPNNGVYEKERYYTLHQRVSHSGSTPPYFTLPCSHPSLFFLPQALLLSLTLSFLNLPGYGMSHALVEAALVEGGCSFTMAEASLSPAGHESMLAPTPGSYQAVEWSKELIWLKMSLAKSKILILSSLKWLIFHLLCYLLLAQMKR